jgi:hypothetical protein
MQQSIIDYNATEMMAKFNKLKEEYENKAIELFEYDEEYLKEQDFKKTIENLNTMVTAKLGELKTIKERVTKLTKYKNKLEEIFKNIRKTEKSYIDLYKVNVLCIDDLRLEKPMCSISELMSSDLGIDQETATIYPTLLRERIFSIKPEYLKSLCDVYEKIEAKIESETFKMKKITDFLDLYKKTIDTCDTHKKTLSKYCCTVCYENEVKICLQPCGHTFCVSCTEKLTTRCFACNGAVTAKIKMYLLGKDDDEVDASNTLADIVPANTNPLAVRTFVGGRWGTGALGSLFTR